MTKIKVPKAIGAVLDSYLGTMDVTLIDLVERHCTKQLRDFEKVLYELNPIELSLAIAHGHEVEISKIEKWNLHIQDIKEQIEYNNEICDYDALNMYQNELNAIRELNKDFELGLII